MGPWLSKGVRLGEPCLASRAGNGSSPEELQPLCVPVMAALPPHTLCPLLLGARVAPGQRAQGLRVPGVCRMAEQAARPSSCRGTKPCAPEPPSALPKLMCRQGKIVSLPVPAAGSGQAFPHTCRHPAPRLEPLLVHSPGFGTHSSLCFSCRAASGPLASVSSHCSGGVAAVDPLVCRDPLVRAFQVSSRRFGVSALPQAVLCCGVSGDGEGSHPSLGAEDAAG